MRLFSYFPDRLNLNGDQGNLLILLRNLQWAGVGVETYALHGEEDLREAAKYVADQGQLAFLLVGHGSIAAMKSIENQRDALARCIQAFEASGTPVLVIGSSYESLKGHEVLEQRVSRFVEAEFTLPALSGLESGASNICSAFGYVNSQTNLAPVLVSGSVVYTLLHGPVLAKSTALLEHYLKYFTKTGLDNEHSMRVRELAEMAIRTAKLS